MRHWAQQSVSIWVALCLFTGAQSAANESVTVAAGSYSTGCSLEDRHCDPDEGPQGGVQVNVPAFKIDIHETSVAEYRRCVQAGQCTRPFDYRRTHYCNYDAPGRDGYPVNCVDWEQAFTYCEYRGGRLAYEVEWEKAARAGSPYRFPWGKTPVSCDQAVMDPGVRGQADTETDGCWRDLSWPRGSFAPNALGLFDMVGGLSEWVMDWYIPGVHAEHFAKGQLTGPTGGAHRTIKGGSWDEKQRAQRVSNRYHKPPRGNPDLYGSNGIRCVTPLPQSLTADQR